MGREEVRTARCLLFQHTALVRSCTTAVPIQGKKLEPPCAEASHSQMDFVLEVQSPKEEVKV